MTMVRNNGRLNLAKRRCPVTESKSPKSYDNHRDCGEALGLDLINYPLMLTQPEHACRSAAWFWWKHGLNELADQENFKRITKRINGGLNGYDDRLSAYDRAQDALAE